jgi:hypothetical protein
MCVRLTIGTFDGIFNWVVATPRCTVHVGGKLKAVLLLVTLATIESHHHLHASRKVVPEYLQGNILSHSNHKVSSVSNNCWTLRTIYHHTNNSNPNLSIET